MLDTDVEESVTEDATDDANDTSADTVEEPDLSWVVRESPTPVGWPELTPVGEVRVRRYPTVRGAYVESQGGNGSQNGMFWPLFLHISRHDIPMTAPVEMTYADPEGSARLVAMGFLYQGSDVGTVGPDGIVEVRDVDAATFVSLGVRGAYTRAALRRGVETLEAWLADHADQWVADGPPRMLGYNGPSIPNANKYGEVQIPVRAAGAR
ncbi:MAG: heme-binding protein [Planctomycetota bacterium]